MKVVLFCGGMGMRMREVSSELPKPLIPICDFPIIVHLMKYYMHYGHDDFILCLGYLGEQFLNYFKDYALEKSTDAKGYVVLRVSLPGEGPSICRITLAETGLNSPIGERLRLVEPLLTGEEFFMANYADGLADLDLKELVATALRGNRIVSFATVRPRQTFHVLTSNESGELVEVTEMGNSSIRVNGGFFVMRPTVFEFLNEGEDFLSEPMQRLVQLRQVMTHPHNGFWACMDTLKEKLEFDERCQRGDMPWQVWKKKEIAPLASC